MNTSKTILLLPGALGCHAQFAELKKHLGPGYDFPQYEFPGYGSRAAENSAHSLKDLANDLCAFLESNHLRGLRVFGHSMGGYVAVLAEQMRPGSFSEIITLGTKWAWDEDFAKAENHKLDLGFLREKAPWFVERMSSYHGQENLEKVFAFTAILMENLGRNPLLNDLNGVDKSCKIVIVRGGKDKMVTEVESTAFAQSHPNATYLRKDDWKHSYEDVPIVELTDVVLDFCRK